MFFKNGRIISKRLTNDYLESMKVKPYLESRVSDIPLELFSYKRIFHHIEKRPVCKVCGKPVTLKGCSYKIFNFYYSNACSHKSKEVKQKALHTNLERYGGPVPCCSKEVLDKIKATNLKRYGTENARTSKVVSEKIEKTNLEKYGCTCVLANKRIKQKAQETNQSKFGCKFALSNKEVREKGMQTILSKYGVDNVAKSKEVQDKIFKTYKQNSSFRTSYPEKVLHSILKEIFPTINYQVRGAKDTYPFNCDFFLKDFDLWIEYHGSMFHNGHPFTDSEEDKHTLELIKSKDDGNHLRYEEQIKTWTIRDPKKLEVAKQNHINLLVLYPTWSKNWSYFLSHKSQTSFLNEAKKELQDIILEFKDVTDKQLIIF